MPQTAYKNNQKGQILLIVVLASVISLTVGLAAISRTVTNNRISTEESNSQKALAAAEAGVEEQLNKNATDITIASNQDLNNNTKFSAIGTEVKGTNIPLNNGGMVDQDIGVDVWLSQYPNFTDPSMSNTRLTVVWDAAEGADCNLSGSNQIPAIEVALIYGDPDNPNMKRYTADPCTTRGNNFSRASATDGSNNSITFDNKTHTYDYAYQFPPAADPMLTQMRIARIIPLYNNAEIGIFSSSGAFPPQGYVVSSKGEAGQAVRTVKVYQGYPRIPVEFFPYNLFTP